MSKGAKQLLTEFLNFYKIKRNAMPALFIHQLEKLIQVIEDTYSVSTPAELQEAIDNIGEEGGTIFIASGIYSITTAIDIDGGGSYVIYGHGDNTILQPVDGVSVFNITNATSVIIRTIKIDTSNYTFANRNVPAVYIDETNNNIVNFFDVTIIGDSVNKYGIGIRLVSDNIIISYCTMSYLQYAVYSLIANRATIAHNSFTLNAVDALYLINGDSYNIFGNYCLINGVNGIYLESIDYSTISGNICTSNKMGGIFAFLCGHNSIANNICNSNENYGIYINTCENNTITGSTCNDNDANTPVDSAGIYITNNSDFNTISGNSLNNNNNIGAGDGFGLIIATATCEENVVAGNNYNGNDIDIMDIGIGTTVEYYVQNTDELQDAIDSIGSGAGVININASFEVSVPIDIDGNGSCLIEGEGDNTVLTTVGDINCFNIDKARQVVLKNFKINASSLTTNTKEIIDVNEDNNNLVIIDNITIIGDGTHGYGIELNSNNCRIENCNISAVGIGINILSTDNILQANKTLNCNTYGIKLGANNNMLTTNTCSGNIVGIYFNSANYNLISGNYCENNTEWGISLNDSNYNSLPNNYYINNDGNSVDPIGGLGINGDSDNNMVIGNTSIDNNNSGAGDGYGLYLGADTDNNYLLANWNSGNDNNFLDLGNNYTFSIAGHDHDGETILIDGINSNGGVFDFLTTDQVNFNQNVLVPNLICAGNVDGVDVSALKTDVDGFPDRLKNLTAAEVQQLENINLKTISETQWGYLGVLNQNLRTTDNVSFNKITLTAGNVVVGAIQLTDDEWMQLANIGVITISVAQWAYLGALDQALATTNSPTFAGLTMTGILNMQENLLILGNAGVADPIELLRFKTERAWSFRKRGVGANARLVLESDVGGKSFWIGYDNGVIWTAKFNISDPQANCYVDLYKLKINGGAVLINSILDEDNMVSDSATALSTQQSIKAWTLSRLLNTGFSTNWSGVVDQAITADKVYDQFVEVVNEITALKYCLNFEGVWDASLETPPDVAPVDGDYWIITTAGTWGGVEWELLDWIVWEATSEKWYKVKYFRQFPVVEVSGNDSIQSAIDQVIYMGGGIVKIHSGTFNDENDTFPITINDGGAGYSLKIEGVGDTTILDPNGDSTIFSITNIGKLILEDFKIDAVDLITIEKEIIDITEANNNPIIIRSITITGDGVNGRGIEINSNNCKVEDCTINNIRHGILLYGNDNTIQENIISSCSGHGIYVAGDKNSLYDNESDNNGQMGIKLSTASYNQINGNYIEGNSQNGILLLTSNYNALNDNYCIGNDSNTANSQGGIVIDADSDNNTIISNTSINNNNIGAGKSYGILINNTNCNRNSIRDNKVSGNDVQYWDLGTNTDIEYFCTTAQEFQEALDSIGSKSGIIKLSTGIFSLSATININGGGTYFIEGSGVGTVLDGETDRIIINITSAKEVVINDLTIDASDNTTTFARNIINIADAVNNPSITIERVIIFGDGSHGIGIKPSQRNVSIENCEIYNVYVGIQTTAVNDCSFIGNYIHNTTSGGIEVWGDYHIVSANIIIDCGSAAGHGIRAVDADYVAITGNTIKGAWSGIETTGGHNCTIVGNSVYENINGISIRGNYMVITGNSIRGNTRKGIDIIGNYCTINGNVIDHNNTNYGESGGGVWLSTFGVIDGDYNIISGNIITDNANIGAGTAYGIKIEHDTCNNNTIGINIFLNNDVDIDDNGIDTRIFGDNTAYGVSWNGNLGTATKDAIYDKIETLGAPIGTIMMFSGVWEDNVTIAGWYKCDGTNGTVNLVDKFVRGGATSGATGGSDDAVVVSHSHDLMDGFTSGGIDFKPDMYAFTSFSWVSGKIKSAGVSGVGKNIPVYYTLIFIQRVA